MPGALDGVRVVDWSVYQVTPYAAAMLADLGAEVIHVEEREHGDLLRGLRSQYGVECMVKGRQINFEEHNRNKKSLAVDLKKPGGRQVIYRLVEKSDVFMTNYRRKAALALGMDYEVLRQRNPRLVYGWASGFGRKGPDSEIPSLDMVAQGRAGAMLSGGEEGWPPAVGVPNAGDRTTSILLAYGVVTALLYRERQGKGQEVHVSQLGAMMNLQGYWLMPILLCGRPLERHTRAKAFNPLYNYYRCQDGKWIVLGCLGSWYWTPFCRAIERPDLETDPRFATEELRTQNSPELIRTIDSVLAARTREEWMQQFKAADLMCSPINALSDLPHDPQVTANEYIREWDHPILGKIQFPGFPVEFGETPAELRRPAPELGQDTEGILTEVCGYSWEDVGRLKAEGVIP